MRIGHRVLANPRHWVGILGFMATGICTRDLGLERIHLAVETGMATSKKITSSRKLQFFGVERHPCLLPQLVARRTDSCPQTLNRFPEFVERAVKLIAITLARFLRRVCFPDWPVMTIV